ncbi:phage major capsid protein [Desulforamulus aquiferis]|uniref:Phage major capsid protein n=1 Tax=Desulforamulus aquiferis TaxID=1397668 RepID=A0AAW7Z9Z4_9FIRM|nr:phage major capsid protein [Desulforamulus aquiferis]MDO7786099.1 phage major capsid protein [Desulforamulus aquiferis]
MNRKEIKAAIREKRSKMSELLKQVDKTNNLDELNKINRQMNELRSAVDDLEDKLLDTIDDGPGQNEEFRSEKLNQNNEQRGAAPVGQLNVLGTYGIGYGNEVNKRSDTKMPKISEEKMQKYEQRGQVLKDGKVAVFGMDEAEELRAVTIGGGTLVVEKKYSNQLSPTFNEVSSLIDTVNAVPLVGGESYTKGFVVGYGEGDYTGETDDYQDAEPVFDYVSTGKAKITAYAELSDEAIKLPNVAYQAEVAKAVRIALRKKISRQIVLGNGGTNQITGIFNAPANVIPTSGDLTLSSIDENTLDKIVFSHGGDEDVEADAYLILNKDDLAQFAAMRDSSGGKRLYQIEKNGNTGTISSDGAFKIKYIINSACPALTDPDTEAGTYCMIYGMPGAAYELPIFSPMEVVESRDYKFKQGIVCFRGSVWAGGNTAMYKGFTRIKKGA